MILCQFSSCLRSRMGFDEIMIKLMPNDKLLNQWGFGISVHAHLYFYMASAIPEVIDNIIHPKGEGSQALLQKLGLAGCPSPTTIRDEIEERLLLPKQTLPLHWLPTYQMSALFSCFKNFLHNVDIFFLLQVIGITRYLWQTLSSLILRLLQLHSHLYVRALREGPVDI